MYTIGWDRILSYMSIGYHLYRYRGISPLKIASVQFQLRALGEYRAQIFFGVLPHRHPHPRWQRHPAQRCPVTPNVIVRGINAPSYLFIVQGLLELNILKRHSLVHHLRFCCTFAIAVFANLLSLLDYFELILTSNSSSTVPIELLFSHSVVSLPRIYFRIFEFRSAELVVGTMTLSVLVYKLLDL